MGETPPQNPEPEQEPAQAEGPTLLRIAEAARAAGVATSTLRLWENQGLVTPERRASGQRLYTADDVARLRRIALLRRETGLSPAAIRATLEAEGAVAAPMRDTISNTLSNEALGSALRQSRLTRGEKLEKVAQALSLSVSALSTLERTGTGVGSQTLAGLARYYGTTVDQLTGQRDGAATDLPPRLVRARDVLVRPIPVEGAMVEVLADRRHAMDCLRVTLAAGVASADGPGIDAEVFVTVLKGRFRLTFSPSESYELEAGDSISFESLPPHHWANTAEGQTVLLCVTAQRTG